MSVLAGKRMGFDFAILEKDKNSPAAQVTNNEFVGWVHNKNILRKFAVSSDIITLENEFVDYRSLEYLERMGKKVYPASSTIKLIQDKLIQKQTLKRKKIPVPQFFPVSHRTDFLNTSEKLGMPFVLKSRKMGYDGYGNALIKSRKDFDEAFERLTRRHSSLLAEKFIDFKMELAVMVARSKNDIVTYPVVQTVQKNHICHLVIAPAGISKASMHKAEQIAVASVEAVKGIGIFGIEMFIDEQGEILVNEMAPRPHNSGHYTIEGCVTSQFENHIRAILNLPLGSAEMVNQHAVMINLLGKRNNSGIVRNYRDVLNDNELHLHIYGKEHSRIGRKMGHITLTGNNIKSLLARARKAEKTIVI